MNIGIFYAGKSGTTEKCANKLASKLAYSKTYNLCNEAPNIDNYDFIIIGSSIRVGLIHKKVKIFINNNKEKLLNKKVAYFICNGILSEENKIFQNNFSKELLNNSIIYKSFGGELILSNQKGIDKFITKMIMKDVNFVEPKIDYEIIDDFIIKVKNTKL